MDYGQLYNEKYYKLYSVENETESYEESENLKNFMDNVADNIIRTLHPTTVLDVGCAMGYLVASLRDRGVKAYGIDVSEYAISKVREDIRPYCRACSALESLPEDFPRKYDLVTTIEVIEHLYEEDGKQFIKNIGTYTDNILFSSTPDDVTEKTHFNVQQPEYWAKIFVENGFLKELIYDTSYISPNASKFVRQTKTNTRMVEDYERSIRSLKSRMIAVCLEKGERENQIIHLNSLLSKKEEQVENLELASQAKDKKIEELEKALACTLKDDKIEELRKTLAYTQEVDYKYQDIIAKQDARIREFIQSSQWLHGEVARWESSYNIISGSACWKLTKPIRVVLDALKGLGYHLKHNFFTHSAKKFCISIRSIGLKDTLRKAKHKLSGQPDIMFSVPVSSTQPGVYDLNVDFLLNQRLRNIQPIQTVIVEDGPKRLNFVTDSIDSHSLLGGVATALIVATEFANRSKLTLRIITRTTPVNPVNYENIMKISEIPTAQDVTYYSDYDRDALGNVTYKLEISEDDIFFATSWWSAAAIRKTSLRKNFYYIIQEVETLFYPHGDEHNRCSEIMQDDNIYYIINSHYLNDYFKEHEPNIVKHGVYFEPAFPKALYQPQSFVQKKKYKLFFYARPNNPRNMFTYGINLLEKSIETGVLDTNEWDIYCAGQAIPELKFSNGYVAQNLGLMSWHEYGEFLGGVDLALSLMYTPHPSYPPFDVACSGGVVVSNRCGNKKTFDWCKNVILSSLEENEFIESMAKGIELAKDMPQRQENFENSTIPRAWQDTLGPTLNFMEGKLKDV